MQKIYGIIFGAIFCAVAASAQPQAAQNQVPAGAAVFRIDSAQSEVRLLVHHSSRMGHNHVIVNRSVSGEVNFTGDASTSSFALTIPVNDFDVDDPTARSEEVHGESDSDFAKGFSAGDRSGTKGHMLGPNLLDGSHFAQITLRSTAITATADGFTATLEVKVAGRQSRLMVPFAFSEIAGKIAATGSVDLRQTDLGLKPLSFMMGAITVQDAVSVKFRLIAAAT